MSEVGLTCGNCMHSEPPFKQARSFGIYDGVLKKAINLFKYQGVKRLAKPLSDMIIKMQLPKVEVLIPVPLFKTRLKQREFNQSALIASHLSKFLDIEILINCLIKVKDTAPQVGLSSRERLRNIRNAFRVSRENLIKGKDILLIDDVVTTGSTIRECSRVLKHAGASDIYVISLAHGISE
jgi:ComF family protein